MNNDNDKDSFKKTRAKFSRNELPQIKDELDEIGLNIQEKEQLKSRIVVFSLLTWFTSRDDYDSTMASSR